MLSGRALGASWARFGKGLGAFRACLGGILGALGRLLGALGRLLGSFWVPLGRSWSHLGSHGWLRARFGGVPGGSGEGFRASGHVFFEVFACVRACSWTAGLQNERGKQSEQGEQEEQGLPKLGLLLQYITCSLDLHIICRTTPMHAFT